MVLFLMVRKLIFLILLTVTYGFWKQVFIFKVCLDDIIGDITKFEFIKNYKLAALEDGYNVLIAYTYQKVLVIIFHTFYICLNFNKRTRRKK